jgi:hypothetical protein
MHGKNLGLGHTSPALLVVIHDLNVKCISISPHETDAVLIDANAVLSSAVSAQRLQMIARRHPQVIDLDGRIQDGEFLESPSPQTSRQTATLPRPPKLFRLHVPETGNHFGVY